MNNKKLYQETFSRVRSYKTICFDDMKRRTERRHLPRKFIIIAAVISLMTAVSAAAFVARWFELKDLELTDEVTVQQPDGTEVTEQVVTGTISLQGFGEMPEKLAVEEWHRFLDSYDYHSVLAELGNAPTGFEEKYGYYQVYTQEMADKLEEIAAKYGLKLHTNALHNVFPGEKLCERVGGDFLGENFAAAAYVYEDGTFGFDGSLSLDGYEKLDYQFIRCVHGSLTDVILNIGDAGAYTEWNYTTKNGAVVVLALAEHKALVFVDLPDCFVTIHVLAGTETPLSDVFSSGPLTAAALERFADGFDFSVLSPVKKPSMDPDHLVQQNEQEKNEEFLLATGISEKEAQKFFSDFFVLLENGEKQAVARLLSYPAVVTVQGEVNYVTGPEELLVYYDDIFTDDLWESIITNQYTRERADLAVEHGMVVAAGGAITFAALEDDILIVTVENALGNRFCQGIA